MTAEHMPTSDPMSDLLGHDDFLSRHIGTLDDESTREMLATIGVRSVDELIDATVPESIRLREDLALGEPMSERDVTAELRRLASANKPRRSLIGMGYTGTITPPVLRRNVLENPAWYTSYTPYQPEISQGRLEALVNFQTMVTDLTGLPIANASLLDEATAAAEAMTMARRTSKKTVNAFFVDADTHPQTIAVLATRAEPLGIDLVVAERDGVLDGDFFGALFSYPTSTGSLTDPRRHIAAAKDAGVVVVVVTDPLACVLVASPASLGADIAVGSAQRFGVPMGFGGPHAAFMATTDSMARSLPGRLVGVSTDTAGRPALRLALQTREQHIRREKATSNICTAQALLANMAGFYACWHGPEGLRRIATRVNRLASMFVEGVRSVGLTTVHDSWFDTVSVRVPGSALAVRDKARAAGFDVRVIDADTVSVTFDEVSDPDEVRSVLSFFGVETTHGFEGRLEGIRSDSRRVEPLLTARVFSAYRTEHEMLRYLRRLADKDLALDRTMIPLGSCTMKLNSTTEMEPITWPEFANVHPFAADDETAGYRELISDLESMLVTVTGYDAVSLQPNAGSQGEFAGLLAIRAYHRSRGDVARDVCLIPSSAHGTNAASAVMAGMSVVVVACDDDGNVDIDDLTNKIASTGDRLAAIMVTYPSTHGVFEDGIGEICRLVHAGGGQVYVDGANLNALVGLARPGAFGADVSHLNLHKTFCIPHGGGGPGVGPVAVKAHLAPFLPGHPLAGHALRGESAVGPVSAAPHGSAGILPISWAYVKLMGARGLRTATEMAIVNANYVARRLDAHYPVLYTGAKGHVAHECIIDLRGITKETGVTVDDVAKRLMDHGFHAPTMSFPVAGTMMIEPTESETKSELDRFCDAMVAIRVEIDRVAAGEIAVEDSPLRHAPHTVADLLGDWDRKYPRSAGAPGGTGYHVPVSRIDAAYGDRNLACTCAPLEAYASSS